MSQKMRRRLYLTVALSLVVGASTGLVVAGIHALIIDAGWNHFASQDAWWVALLPIGGLLGSGLLIQLSHDSSSETTEEYVRVFHEPMGHFRLRSVPQRLAASLSTIALGGSMGLEGPSIYIGAAVGDVVERRTEKLLTMEDRKLLVVAGAAAGIAAIFKAPVTGIVFALEVPYRDDLARRALIPAMFAAASGYVMFVAIAGTAPLFPVAASPLRMADLGGSLLVGLACGVAARFFIKLFRTAMSFLRRFTFGMRALLGGAVVSGMGAASIAAFHRPFALGPGYEAIAQAARGQIGLGLMLALFAMKMLATTATAAGGGVGGLFFPSVLMGAALGGAVGHAVSGPASLFAVVGIAAFLGGTYKVPLAGVAFVAETTGAPGYIIPGLLAAALAYIVSGRGSLSQRQRYRRVLDLETRLDMRVSDVMSREWVEVPPTATLHDFADDYAIRAKARVLPVAENARYLGMMSLSSLGEMPRERWATILVSEVARTDYPVLHPHEWLGDAMRSMREAGVERAAALEDGRIVGMIQISDIIQLEQIVDAIGEEERRGWF